MDSSKSKSESGSGSGYSDRIIALAEQAQRDRVAFDPLTPDALDENENENENEERAMSFLTSGFGPTVGLYIEARTGENQVRLSAEEMTLLERAMNDWLSLYARCYDVGINPEFTVREAAALLLETHNIRETAQLLTQVPASRKTSTND